MPTLRDLALLTAGALLGGFAGWTLASGRAPTRTAADAPAPRPTRTRTDAAPDAVAVDPDPSGGDAALEACTLKARLLAGQLAAYEGRWQDWPAGVDPRFSRSALQEALPAAWAELAHLDELDCSEYPCLATVTLLGDPSSCCLQLVDALPDELLERGARAHRTYAHALEDGRYRGVISLGTEEHWSDAIATRTSWRIERAGERLDDEP